VFRRFAPVLIAIAVLAAPIAAGNHGTMRYETEESPRVSHQRTCVEEAYLWPDIPSCEVYGTNQASPPSGVLILDAMLWSPGVSTAHPQVRAGSSGVAHSLSRETGFVPEAIWPGPVNARAFYGFWADENANGVIDQKVRTRPAGAAGVAFDGYDPGNEYVPVGGHAPLKNRLYAFIEPGSHPHFTESSTRPPANEPDFRYTGGVDAETRLHQANIFIVFLDGSLLLTYTMETVSEVSLVPDLVNARPYSVEPWSRVDVDTYAALAPGPVAALYRATAGSAVNEASTPGLGMCPETCTVPPAPLSAAAPVVAAAYAPYEAEIDPSYAADPRTASTNAGRLEEYRSRYAGWIDLLPNLGAPTGGESALKKAHPLPALGRDANGNRAIAVPPNGFFAVEVWTGVFRDLNGDGFVGAVGDDPYEGGNRPVGHRYLDAKGEFVPWDTKRAGTNMDSFRIVLTPDTTWGTPGVMRWSSIPTPVADDACTLLANPCVKGYSFITGSEPIVLDAPSFYATQIGHRLTNPYLWFPRGTAEGGFTVCTEPRSIEFKEADVDVTETLQDCDRVERLSP